MMPADLGSDAERLREAMAKALAADGALADFCRRAAVEKVPRHRFVPGCDGVPEPDQQPRLRPARSPSCCRCLPHGLRDHGRAR
jgi:hypothetical protein